MSETLMVTIERRRFAALIEALKLAHFALKTSRMFSYGPDNSYVITAKLGEAIKDATHADREVRL